MVPFWLSEEKYKICRQPKPKYLKINFDNNLLSTGIACGMYKDFEMQKIPALLVINKLYVHFLITVYLYLH
jgi:hypothetical protein